MTDSRDGHNYRTITIAGQTWMAENLNYAGAGFCYDDNSANCATYGRLYTWAEVMQGSSPSFTIPSGVKGICPTGWHVPSYDEWTKLTNTTQPDVTAGTKLKSNSNLWITNTGIDVYHFSALSAGYRHSYNGLFYNRGYTANFWTASDIDFYLARSLFMSYTKTNIETSQPEKTTALSLRCVAD